MLRPCSLRFPWHQRRPGLLAVILWATLRPANAQEPVRDPGFPFPRRAPLAFQSGSSSMALSVSNRTLFVADDGSGTVAAIRVNGGGSQRILAATVGGEPTSIVATPDGGKVFVTNRTSGEVIEMEPGTLRVTARIFLGGEPAGCVLDHSGTRLFVANFTGERVHIIDTRTRSVKTVALESNAFPFAIAAGPPQPGAEQLIYAPHFFSPLKSGVRPDTESEPEDETSGRRGRVSVISSLNGTVTTVIELPPIPTGFNSDRTAFGGTSNTTTSGFPNVLDAITVRGNRAYITNVGASPRGPVNFQTNTQAFVHVINLDTNTELRGGHFNMNKAVERENPKGFFFNTPFGMAFGPETNWGYVLSAASNLAVKIKVDSQGFPSIEGNQTPNSLAGIVRIEVGKNPRSVIFTGDATTAFVHNHVSRDISVIDALTDTVAGTIPIVNPPASGSLAASILHGEELFDTSRGDSTVDPNLKNRMSTNGWGSCFSCHPFGWTDTVIWSFASGPRKSLPLIGDFSRKDLADQRILNYSAIFDEVEDFELNIRLVSSNPNADQSTGLIIGVPRADITPLTPTANGGRSRDWTDIENYIQTIRPPVSPVRPEQVAGPKALFHSLGCTLCHGGDKWSTNRLFWKPPPGAAPPTIVNGEVTDVLRKVDTLLAGEVTAGNQPARGANGFNPPSLLGMWMFPPFFHNGRAATLEEVLTLRINSKSHTEASTLQPVFPAQIPELVRFLRSIDHRTAPFPILKDICVGR